LCDDLVGYVMIYPVMWWSSRVCDETIGISDGLTGFNVLIFTVFIALHILNKHTDCWLEPYFCTGLTSPSDAPVAWVGASLDTDPPPNECPVQVTEPNPPSWRRRWTQRQTTQVVWISDILPNASEGRRRLSSNPSNVWTTYEVVLIKELAKSDLFSSLATSVSYSCVITRNIPSTLPSWPRCRHLAVSITGRWSSTRRDLVSASCCYVTEITQRRSAGEH